MKVILNSDEIDKVISRLAEEIVKSNKELSKLCLVGIQRGGVQIARRIAEKIKSKENIDIPVGSLDISFYRDDIGIRKGHPVVRETDINFDITNKMVVLVDDVLYTGRSTRAALDALLDMGRPLEIQLAVLIDRGHREFPICAQYVGMEVSTELNETIEVELSEGDHGDRVLILSKGEKTA